MEISDSDKAEEEKNKEHQESDVAHPLQRTDESCLQTGLIWDFECVNTKKVKVKQTLFYALRTVWVQQELACLNKSILNFHTTFLCCYDF